MIEMLISLLILLVVIYVANLVIDQLNLPPAVKTIAYLIVGLIGLVILLEKFGIYHLRP